MAVNVGTVPVYPDGSNEAQTGWTQAHVMNALEKVFYEMGFNSGTQKNGVPQAILYPGCDKTSQYDFAYCIENHWDETPKPHNSNSGEKWITCGGGAIPQVTQKTRRFYVTNSGTQSYQIAEELKPSSWGVTNNVIQVSGYMGDNFTTGTKLTYNGQGTDVIDGLSSGNVYYMRRVSDNTITLHNSASNANSNTGIQSCTSTSLSDAKRFRTDAQTNPAITCNRNDKLYFYTHATTDGGQFRICDFLAGSGYNADRDMHNQDNLSSSLMDVTGSGTYASPYYWETKYWDQTENEYKDETKTVPNSGYTSLAAYGYANTVNANLKGTITLNSAYTTGGNSHSGYYYKYTVPASGNRGALKLRIYRGDSGTTYGGKVTGIHICNEATGWSDNEVFTIPGTAVGGTSPAHDIEFGVNTLETSNGAADGKCSILTTNLGSGANMFQKHPDGHYGVLRLEHNSSKTYGHTYWGFALQADNMYRMTIQCGSGWSYINRLGTNYTYNSSTEGWFGVFNGDKGLDHQSGSNLHRNDYNYHNYHSYATSSGPTNYPLKIKYYKAQAPQDTNYGVISFVQTINGVDRVYFTFSLNKGASFGGNVWDLDEVWNGGYVEYRTYRSWQGSSQDHVKMIYHIPGYHYTTGPHTQPTSTASLAREANYGYLRSTSGHTVLETHYGINIDRSMANEEDGVWQYYRNDTYDKVVNNDDDIQVKINGTKSPGFSYYKPLKGLPINNNIVPCPYYIPDDFVIIQAAVTPGATEFRVGDTITVSGSEVYTIIIADEYNNQTGLDGIDNNTACGSIFAARTT